MAVYDDQKEKVGISDEDLRQATGISSKEEAAMDHRAATGEHPGDIEREGIGRHTGKAGEGSAAEAVSSGAKKGAAAGAAGAALDAATPLGKLKKLKGAMLGTRKRKAATIGGGFATVGGAAAISLLVLFSGPFEVVQLAHLLEKPFAAQDDASSSRLSKLFRYARAYKQGDIGETRVGVIGSKVFGNTIDQLKEAGIEFERNPINGRPQSMTVDTAKLEKKFPELKGMSATEAQAYLSQQFNEAKFQKVGAGSSKGTFKFTVDTSDYGIKATRVLTNDSLSVLDNGKIVTGLKTRVLAKFFDTPSLFHPIEKAQAATRDKIATATARRAAEEERNKTLRQPTDEKAVAAAEPIKDKLSNTKKAAGAILLVTGTMCMIRSVADDVEHINQAAIVAPAVLQATDHIAVGEQMESGKDATADQFGAVTESLNDSDGKSVFSGKAMHALAGEPLSGPDIPDSFQQAFSNKTTAENIRNEFGGGIVGDIACSKIGIIAQAVAGVGLLVSGVFDGGASWAAKGALAAGEAAKFVATAGIFYLLEQQATNLLADKAIVPHVLSGPLGGNILAYGARASANTSYRAAGGIQLSGTQTSQIEQKTLAESERQFRSESLYARMFDINDYRSLTGHMANSAVQSGGVTQVASSFLNINTMFSSIFSALVPKTHAASQTYQWGFPLYGLPQQILNDKEFENPYISDTQVGHILDTSAGDALKQRALSCFGVTVTNNGDGWTVIPDHEVDPNSQEYTDAKCADTSDHTWKQMIMFVFDTRTAEAAACYSGDDTACQNLGIDINNGSTGGANIRVASFNVEGASHTRTYKDRMDRSIAAITANSIDVVGLQELQSSQRTYMLNQSMISSKYDIYPATGNNDGHRSENSILYDKTKFTRVDAGIQPDLVYFGGSKLSAPWVRLQDNDSGQEFYVLNTHDPADALGYHSAQGRYHNALAHKAFITKLAADGIPIYYTGDFNSGYTTRPPGHNGSPFEGKVENLTYCILTGSKVINDSYDVYKNRPVKCPNGQTPPDNSGNALGGIDHVYVSDGIQIPKYFRLDKGESNDGSDHPVLIVDTIIPAQDVSGAGGTGGAATTGSSFVGNDGFGGGSCVDYVKYILARHSSKYHGGTLGNGKDVANGLKRFGYTTSHNPSLHATVSFPTSLADPTFGHVALVAAINKDGSITVEEANWTHPNRYGTHVVKASQVHLLTYANTGDGWH